MHVYPFSIAGQFKFEDSHEFSICFFATLNDEVSETEVRDYIINSAFYRIAKLLPRLNQTSLRELTDSIAVEISRVFNIQCFGYVNDAFLTVFDTKSCVS